MDANDRRSHWEGVYTTKGEAEVSWFQDSPAVSLDLIAAVGAAAGSAIIDIGGGASRLVDHLLALGHGALTVLDLSAAALETAKARLGRQAELVHWITADVTRWNPTATYDVWHDRAAFHFLIEAHDRAAYVARLNKALRPGGHAIIATFALNGPERCSGLPIQRYDAATLRQTLGDAFTLVETRADAHQTPWGSTQLFQFSVFRFEG